MGTTFCFTCRLLTAAVSLAAGHRLQVHQCQRLQRAGSVVVAHGLSCSAACGTFPDEGSNWSFALQGWFLTTGPPGKPPTQTFISFHQPAILLLHSLIQQIILKQAVLKTAGLMNPVDSWEWERTPKNTCVLSIDFYCIRNQNQEMFRIHINVCAKNNNKPSPS